MMSVRALFSQYTFGGCALAPFGAIYIFHNYIFFVLQYLYMNKALAHLERANELLAFGGRHDWQARSKCGSGLSVKEYTKVVENKRNRMGERCPLNRVYSGNGCKQKGKCILQSTARKYDREQDSHKDIVRGAAATRVDEVRQDIVREDEQKARRAAAARVDEVRRDIVREDEQKARRAASKQVQGSDHSRSEVREEKVHRKSKKVQELEARDQHRLSEWNRKEKSKAEFLATGVWDPQASEDDDNDVDIIKGRRSHRIKVMDDDDTEDDDT